MKIYVSDERAVFIEIDEWTFYIDNSTDEAIMDKWEIGEDFED